MRRIKNSNFRIYFRDKLTVFPRSMAHKLIPFTVRVCIGEWVRVIRRRLYLREIQIAETVSEVLDKSVIFKEVSEVNHPIKFEILILSSVKHIEKLEVNLGQLVRIYGDRVGVTVLHENAKQFQLLKETSRATNIEYLNEEVFSQEISILDGVLRKFNPDRYTWLLQQVLKTLFVASRRSPVLILDCDTLITRGIDFLFNNKNVLFIGSKAHSHFHLPYSIQVERFFRIKSSLVNFVHHCQLQRPEFIKEIYGNHLIDGISKWLECGLMAFEFSSVSEFQTYGEFMLNRYPEEVILYSHTHHLETVTRGAHGMTDYKSLLAPHILHNCRSTCDLVTWNVIDS